MQEFEGQGVLVVGAGGIGAEICRQVAAGGGRVFFTYNRDADRAAEVAGSIPAEALAGHAQLDVTDPGAVASVVDRAAEDLGRLDAAITTVGYLHHLSLFEDDSLEEIRRTIDVELFGVLHLAKAVVPRMRAAGYGRFVTVGSDSGKVGSKAEASSAAARGGVIAFSKALARETADTDICVNVVCAGPTDTDLLQEMLADEGMSGKLMNAMVRAIPKRRIAKVDEVVALTLFLSSPSASFVTGQAISVTGGLTMS